MVDPIPAAHPILGLKDLRYRIGERQLLRGLTLDLAPGESVAVTGPSGSGKSTLLSLVLGLVTAGKGQVSVAGRDMSELRGKRLARHRARHLSMVFQFGELLPELTPVENVALPALLAGESRQDAYERAAGLLREVGVTGTSATTGELSGGERQRTAVARALMNKPSLILADEPTGSLDPAARSVVADLLFSLPERWGCGLLVATHDPSVAARAHRHLSLHDGLLHTERVAT
ncbi:ABC transporter ATP-binding protein [Streptomyces lydicus]|uniref:ABC transporter ATP-binding protein n=1 Tax=Streptomyces lydicus TaxID=47763 RepID=UPI0005248B3A|nr:ABC transporter ATP-binding protein [Streptomyces lydicus]MDC7335562.1 ABC transporter ATP-binding protein [Streptomyces lydicus]UEG95207.1 ABC transporter ATP-binding protein [Streptomyces lydicus]